MICFCAAMLFWGLSTSFLAPLVTRITGNLGISLSAFSGLLILRSLALSAGSFLLGRIQRRISANKLIALGMLLLPLLALIYPQTGSLPLFSAVLLVWGLAGTLIEGGADIRNGDLPEDFAGQLNFLQYAAMSIGAMSGPILLRMVMRRDADVLRLPFYALLPALVFAVRIWFLPEGSRADRKQEQTHTVLSRVIVLAGVMMFFACGVDGALNNWSPTAVLREGIADEANAALMTMSFAVGSLLSRLISAGAIRKVRTEMIFTFSVSAVLAASVGMLFTRSYAVMLCLEFLFGFGNGSVFSSLLLLLRKRGFADGGSIGFIIGLKNIGEMIISWLAGISLDYGGAAACFGVLALGAAVSFALHFYLRNSGTGSKKDDPACSPQG